MEEGRSITGNSSTTRVLGDAERVAASLENWKRKLLDLSKRNRALNFKMSKVSTIAIVDEQPAEVFRQLYVRERPMRFKAAPEAEEQLSLIENKTSLTSATEPQVGQGRVNEGSEAALLSPSELSEQSQPGADEDEDESLNLDFAPYDPSTLDERQTDDWLQTMSRPEALDKSLRRIDEQARLAIEEQGVNTLFLALGMLHYAGSPDSEQVFKAPLVLLPVELTRKSARSGYQNSHHRRRAHRKSGADRVPAGTRNSAARIA